MRLLSCLRLVTSLGLVCCAPAQSRFPVPTSTASLSRPVPGPVYPSSEFTAAITRGTRTPSGRPGPGYWVQHARYSIDAQIDPKPWLRVRLAGDADGLAADRGGTARDAKADALEAWVEMSGAHADLRAGIGRLSWGRLDEVQPTDVINPIDVARFLLEGRSEARLPVPFVRGRLMGGEALRLDRLILGPVEQIRTTRRQRAQPATR